MPSDGIVIDSLKRRIGALHLVWEEAVSTMSLEQVNYVERDPILPIAFSLFHFVQIEDGSATMLGAGQIIFDEKWASCLKLAINDHGKHKTVSEMMAQRIGDYEAFKEYMVAVFRKTEGWLDTLSLSDLEEVVAAKPFPPMIATTFSAKVAGDSDMTRLDAIECWIYQHGLRHMGEIEHARSLVGLGGMTS
ncbi:MAG: hypothetical protein HKL80_09885 [Acidimicrobiales bacterium]|nr:hypothetical protein [Acidimicrobiales bacterium]